MLNLLEKLNQLLWIAMRIFIDIDLRGSMLGLLGSRRYEAQDKKEDDLESIHRARSH